MKSVAAIASILLSNSGLSEATIATATFGSTEIEGSVTVDDGLISVDIDLTNLNESMLPVPNCTVGGLKYHIHTKWNYNDTNDRLGSTECNATYTGGHYDPWLGCSSSSSNHFCETQGGCVYGSSSLGNVGDITTYNCTTDNFDKDPYACEVGDWSGKYGTLDVDVGTVGTIEGASPFEVDGADLGGYSVVFHCNDDTRFFCAPFVIDETGKADRVTQDDATSKQAQFSDLGDSEIILETTGEVSVYFDLENADIPDNCGDYLYYRVFTDWSTDNDDNSTDTLGRRRLLQTNDTNATLGPVGGNTTAAGVPTSAPTMMPTAVQINCSAVVGSFYDPTITCDTNTEQTVYCTRLDNSKLCGNESYSYTCNRTEDSYECAPGDLSGKYGAINIRDNSTTIHSFETSDDLMISLDLLVGKSAVLQCSSSQEIISCAEWIDYSGASSSKNNSETPVWVWIVVAIGVVLLIAGAIFLRKRCTSDDSYTRIQQ